MTEFKAPLPPGNFKAPPVTPPNSTVGQQQPTVEPTTPPAVPQQQLNPQGQETPSAAQEVQVEENAVQDEQEVSETPLPSSKKNILFMVGALVVGLLMGAVMFGGNSAPQEQAPRTLPGVVSNPDIRGQKLQRCGQVDASQTCILYIMNDKTYDKRAQDFFESAVVLTNRSKFAIQTANVQYGTIRIPAGFFAELKIPPYGR